MNARPFRRAGAVLGGVSLLMLSITGGELLSACGSDSTTGARFALKTRVVADDSIEAPFTNAFGWSIQLQRAVLSISALYYFDGAPIFSQRVPPRLPLHEVWPAIFGARTAHAHPGHYQTGNAVGEMLAPRAVDLALGSVDLSPGQGTSGTYRSARFVFGDSPTGPLADTLGGYVVLLEGKGTKGSQARRFRALADIVDVADGYREPKLDGCAFEEAAEVEMSGTVTLHIKPSVWLDQVDLSELVEGTGEPVEITPDLVAFEALTRGLKKAAAMVFTYTPGSPNAEVD